MRQKVLVASHPKEEDSGEVGLMLEEEAEIEKWHAIHVVKLDTSHGSSQRENLQIKGMQIFLRLVRSSMKRHR